MTDFLLNLANDKRSAAVVKSLGLPTPTRLARTKGPTVAGELQGKTALVLSAPSAYASDIATSTLQAAGATVVASVDLQVDARIDALVLDLSGCATVEVLQSLYTQTQPMMRRIGKNARILLIATHPDALTDPVAAGCARGVEGFMRSLGKEVGKRGAVANLAYVRPDRVAGLAGVVGFFCSPRCTYVSGQAVTLSSVGSTLESASELYGKVLTGKTAVVTGCARGIGRAIAQRLAEEGAHVIAIDVESARDALYEAALQWGGTPLVLDIASVTAPAELAALIERKFTAVDIVVHNAGITRDKTLANMTTVQWDLVMAVNFQAIAAIDKELLSRNLVRHNGRLVALSSISGVAGNFGQTNYATSKAALIGYVRALGRGLAVQGITVNAVAPGFIETPMTQKVPLFTREAGRRLNSLSQGGQPRDVAELVCFLASPSAAAVSGNTIRVCGQALIGA
jgi:3-oxoacyl-[acyl-carrier protein] reductase